VTPLLFDSQKDDVASLAMLHAESFPDAWSAVAIAGLLATPGAFAFHLQHGFVLVRAGGGEAEILTLAVMSAMRGQGLGRDLLLAAARHAETLGAEVLILEVGIDNPSALALYAGLGFARAGQRKAYYGAASRVGQDALILKAQLPLSQDRKFA
jgi:ribosomal-protein-alanine N-acetyltransferase